MNFTKLYKNMQNKFLQYLDAQIQLEMKMSATSDGKRLTGLRNIKSDFAYEITKKDAKPFLDIINQMYKTRQETSKIYKDVNMDLYLQEQIELKILEPFAPKEVSQNEVFDFLNTTDIEKSRKNFKKFQEKCYEKFGYTIPSNIILEYLNS